MHTTTRRWLQAEQEAVEERMAENAEQVPQLLAAVAMD
jgi:hypothetical protein